MAPNSPSMLLVANTLPASQTLKGFSSQKSTLPRDMIRIVNYCFAGRLELSSVVVVNNFFHTRLQIKEFL